MVTNTCSRFLLLTVSDRMVMAIPDPDNSAFVYVRSGTEMSTPLPVKCSPSHPLWS